MSFSLVRIAQYATWSEAEKALCEGADAGLTMTVELVHCDHRDVMVYRVTWRE